MIKANYYQLSGQPGEELTLPEDVFGLKLNSQLLAQAVRVFLANQRKAAANTKTRALVNRTHAKWYKQKGTGRARHGARSAPIFVGGGIAHGPKSEANHKLSLSSKMKQKALAVALSLRLSDKNLMFVNAEGGNANSKTRKMNLAVKSLGLALLKIRWVTGTGEEEIRQGLRNLPNVLLCDAATLTAYEVLDCKKLVISKNGIESLKARFGVVEKVETKTKQTKRRKTL